MIRAANVRSSCCCHALIEAARVEQAQNEYISSEAWSQTVPLLTVKLSATGGSREWETIAFSHVLSNDLTRLQWTLQVTQIVLIKLNVYLVSFYCQFRTAHCHSGKCTSAKEFLQSSYLVLMSVRNCHD